MIRCVAHQSLLWAGSELTIVLNVWINVSDEDEDANAILVRSKKAYVQRYELD